MSAATLPLARPSLQVRALTVRLPNPAGAIAFIAYLVLGSYLALILHAYHGDAYSRVANAYYVLFSRDPHLAAIGFVWMPLPSLFELVLLPVKVVFPAIATEGFAAVIMSATFMALAVATMDGILRDFGVRGPARLGLVGAFAFNPMILYYGSIGTSEAPMLFFALLGCRYLARYVVTASTSNLVGLGLALAGGYLTRYEAAAAAVGVAGVIVLISLARLAGTFRHRFSVALADIVVALAPFVLVFVAWAAASWIIIGSPFSQFTSEYGNSSQMAVWAAQGANEIGLPLGPSIGLAALRLAALSLAAPIGVLAGLWVLAIRRDVRVLAIGGVFAPMLAFMVLAYLVHVVAPWLRYFILVIPLAILLVGLALASRPAGAAGVTFQKRRMPRWASRAATVLATALLLAVVFASVPVAAFGMLNPTVAVEESKDVGALLSPKANAPDRPGAALRTFAGEAKVAAYIDAMDIPPGSVLLDVFSGFSIVVLSDRPDRFVTTTDQDFKQALADPTTFGVKYVLAPSMEGNGVMDAVNRSYPDLGLEKSFATVSARFPAIGTSATWTLYRLVDAP